MSSLSTFIRENTEQILTEWEAFARSLPAGDTMDIEALRDHARAMLDVVTEDLDQPQSAQAQSSKSRGESDAPERGSATAAQEHGTGRAGSGFTIEQMVAEFRALRASVTRLWLAQLPAVELSHLEEVIRFDEAIDQAIAESVARFNQAVTRTQERFLAILSHDLRTPLGAILMGTQFLLEEAELPEPQRAMMSRMKSSAHRMNQMVLDLVEFTRTRLNDAIPIDRTSVDGGKVVREVVQEICASYPGSTVEMSTEGDLQGEWDADRLAQALTNLVGNAIQHGTRQGPVRIVATGSDDEIVIEVHNQGPAIPPDELATIFGEGARGTTNRGAHDRRHLGLGLYIVDRIIAAHDGSIAVRSTHAEGTMFAVRLPRRAGKAD